MLFAVFLFSPQAHGYTDDISDPELPSWLKPLPPGADVTTFVGNGSASSAPGTGTSSPFANAMQIAIDGSGNFYVVDNGGHSVRKITPDGSFTTLAGSGSAGYMDGTGTSAQFNFPRGIAVDSNGNVYVVDVANNRLRKITPSGVVTTLAGTGGPGSLDGTGTNAQFSFPSGLSIDASDNLYMADRNNHKIRKITPDGMVTTFAGSGTIGTLDGTGINANFEGPEGIVVAPDGNVYITQSGHSMVRKITPEGVVTSIAGTTAGEGLVDGTGTSARFKNPSGITIDGDGNLFVADRENFSIRKVTPAGVVTTVAGGSAGGFIDDIGTSAKFNLPSDIVITANGDLYVADQGNNSVRKITGLATRPVPNNAPEFTSIPDTEVNAGDDYSYKVSTTDADGDALTVTAPTLPEWMSLDLEPSEVNTFTNVVNTPNYIERDNMGNTYVADVGDFSIKKISPEGVITVIAGNGSSAHLDGTGTSAQFTSPNGITMDDAGNLYVTDAHRVRKITPSGVVTTFAGSGGFSLSDGTGTEASFRLPTDLDVGPDGNIYVVDRINNRIRKITPSGVVSTFLGGGTVGLSDATGTSAEFTAPIGIVIDELGNIYMAQQGAIRKATPAGLVTTIAGSGSTAAADGTGSSAGFHTPTGITLGNDGNLYVADNQANQIRRVTMDGVVTRIAGAGQNSFRDGEALNALFNQPVDLAVAENGDIYISDHRNGSIRVLTPECLVLSGDATGQSGDHAVVLQVADGNGDPVQQSFTVSVQTTPTVTASAASNVTPNSATINGNVSSDGDSEITERGFVGTLTGFDPTPTLAEVNGTTVFKLVVSGDVGTFDASLINLPGNTSYSYIAYATNALGTTESTVQTFTTPNNAPEFTSVPDTEVNAGDDYSYKVSTTDADGDALTVTAPTLPEWMSLDLEPSEVNTFTNVVNTPNYIERDNMGNIYVADAGDFSVKKISPEGIITVIAGNGSSAHLDGTGTSAQFTSPNGITMDDAGNLYVTDAHRVRKITPSGVVTTFAGSGGFSLSDGTGTEASFRLPTDLDVGPDGNIYVVDRINNRIRKITPAGVVSTFLGGGTVGLSDATGTSAEFTAPIGIVIDELGNIYIAQQGAIRKATPAGLVTTIAGSGSTAAADGTGSSAGFHTPTGITLGNDGNLYVADNQANQIRRVTMDGVVTRIAGAGQNSFRDGEALNALFNQPVDLAVAENGDIYISDHRNGSIRVLTPECLVLNGTPPEQSEDYPVVLQVADGNGDPVQQSFTVSVINNDNVAPTLTASNPADGSEQFSGAQLTFTFDEDIVKGRGRISIRDAADDIEILGTGIGNARISITDNTATLTLPRALPFGKDVYVLIPRGAFKDGNNNNFAGVLDKETLSFSTISLPELVSSNPVDGATEFGGTTIALTFSRNMVKGNGRISVRDAETDMEITGAGIASNRVTIADNVVTFNLINRLPSNKEVYLTIPASAFKDANNNFYEGILDKTTLNFSSLSALAITASTPADNSDDFNGTSISFTFNRNVVKGSGRISILDQADDRELSGAGINNARVSIAGNVVTLDMGRELPTDKDVYVRIPGSAFRDANGVAFGGILDKTTLNFSTITTPQLLSTNPADDSGAYTGTTISFTFDRPMIKGRGRIEVFNTITDERITSAGVASSRVTIDGNVVTFDLIKALPEGVPVYVRMPRVAFKDANDLFYAGILDKTTLDFGVVELEDRGNPINLTDEVQGKVVNTVLSVYPNPAVNGINIDLSEMGEEPTVRIVNINGVVKLTEKAVKTPVLRVDVSSYMEGVYIIASQSKSGQVVYKKFIIKR